MCHCARWTGASEKLDLPVDLSISLWYIIHYLGKVDIFEITYYYTNSQVYTTFVLLSLVLFHAINYKPSNYNRSYFFSPLNNETSVMIYSALDTEDGTFAKGNALAREFL